MNRIIATTIFSAFLAAASAAVAQDKVDEHAGHHPPAQAGAKSDDATAKQPGDDMRMQHMHDNMKKMHELMEKIHASKNPDEVHRLLEEHHHAMNEQFQMMRGMGKGKMPMMGMQHGKDDRGAAPPARDGQKENMMGGDMMKHHEMMMHRLDMMQDMMEQMMEHMSAEQHMMNREPPKKK